MGMFGDGHEERMDALDLEIRLRSNPEIERRRKQHHEQIARALEAAKAMSSAEVIDALINHNPAYIRALLETEDDRFGAGALASRYAHTFWKNYALRHGPSGYGPWIIPAGQQGADEAVEQARAILTGSETQ